MWNQQPLMPGNWDTIYGKYDTKRLGPINKTMTVECNDTSKPFIVLKIKGKIIPRPILDIAIKVNEITTMPDDMNTIKLVRSSKDSALYSFSLTNLSTKPRTISSAEYQSQPSKWGFFITKEQPLFGELIMKPSETITLQIKQKPILTKSGYYSEPALIIDGQELKIDLK